MSVAFSVISVGAGKLDSRLVTLHAISVYITIAGDVIRDALYRFYQGVLYY